MTAIDLTASNVPLIDSSNPQPIPWDEYEPDLLSRWNTLLESAPGEGVVQQFLETNPTLLPGVNEYNTGHHSPLGGVLYSQPQLRNIGKNRRPDFMWLGKTSGELTPVLIEIEKPNLRWFTQAGTTTAHLNQAHGQLAEWKSWFSRPENETRFREQYYSWPDGIDDRLPMNPTYILIYGRRTEFENDDTGELSRRRAEIANATEVLMTFDRLRPNRYLQDVVTVKHRADGRLEIIRMPACYTTGPLTGETSSRIGAADAVIDAVEGWSEERKEWIKTRWAHWASVYESATKRPDSIRRGE